jgi:hypothetical protein
MGLRSEGGCSLGGRDAQDEAAEMAIEAVI